jgi:hypothetical protein
MRKSNKVSGNSALMPWYCCINGVWEACFETAGDDIPESVTQEVVGDYIVPAHF